MSVSKNKFLQALSFILLIALFFTMAVPTPASAATFYNSYTTEDGLIIEETLTVFPEKANTGISTFSTGKKKTAKKTHKIKNSSGTVLATYTLTGTFTYGTGAPAKCDSASYSTSISDSHGSFIANAAYSSGNQAIGTYTFRYAIFTISKDYVESLTITCSVYGYIS